MNTYSTVIKIYCGRNIISEVMYHVFRQFQRNTIEKNAVFMKFRKPLLYPLSYPGMNRKISRRKSHARRENLFQYLEMTSVAFEPPKPKLLLIA